MSPAATSPHPSHTRPVLALLLVAVLGSCTMLPGKRQPVVAFDDRRIASPVFESATTCNDYLDITSENQADNPHESFGPRLAVASWNVHKSADEHWRSDLRQLPEEVDILALQEAAILPAMEEAVPHAAVAISEGFYSVVGPTGLLTASHVKPLASCTFLDMEPALKTRKASSVTRYPISDSEETLLLVNVHAINFSLGLRAYARQLNRLAIAMQKHSGPIVFAGDLNIWHAKRADLVEQITVYLGLREVELEEDHRTVVFGHALDRIYSRGLPLTGATTVRLESSDHNAVVAVWDLTDL